MRVITITCFNYHCNKNNILVAHIEIYVYRELLKTVNNPENNYNFKKKSSSRLLVIIQ